jgi:hypothetical protein
MRRTLLLSDGPPCPDHSGCLNLLRICNTLPIESLACYVVSAYLHDVQPSPALSRMPFRTRKGPPFTLGAGRLGRVPLLRSVASLVHDRFVSVPGLVPVIDDIVQFAREQSIEVVWCVLQGQTMIRLALPVAQALGVPLLTQVWDHPTWWLREHRLNAISRAGVLRQFGQTLAANRCCAATSRPMADEYASRFNATTVPLIPFLPDDYRVKPARLNSSSDSFTIGLAGQLYASKEWQALLKALDLTNWTVDGKQIVIRYFGRHPISHAHPNARIDTLGWKPERECLALMSTMDALYCPYWFDPVFESEARFSFPSKLVTYLAAGRPVFFHGPDYSSSVPLFRERDIGICCHSLEPHIVLRDLKALLHSDIWGRLARNAGDAFSECLSLTSQLPSLATFFEVPVASLSAGSNQTASGAA